MIGSAAVSALSHGLTERRESIRAEGVSYADWRDLLRKAVDAEPRVMGFFGGATVESSRGGITLTPRYVNGELSLSDVTYASFAANAIDALRRTAKEYGQKAVVVSRPGLDLEDCVRLFLDQAGAAMPLLESVQTEVAEYGDLPYRRYEFALKYRLGYTKLTMMREATEKEARRLASILFTRDMPAAAKIYLAHNYLCQNVTYQRNAVTKLASASKQCAYGALIEKLCVCQGFAEAFQMLMDLEGIPCRLQDGVILRSGGGHAWNLVAPDGRRWSHLDATWDSVASRPRYDHFCVGDAAYAGLRTWNRDFAHVCDGDPGILPAAREYVRAHRCALLARGIAADVLDA